MEVGAAVGAITHGGVTIGDEFVVVRAERLPGLVCRLVQHDNHEGAHQEGRVALLGVVQARVMIDLVVLVLLVVHEFLQLLAKQVHLTKV